MNFTKSKSNLDSLDVESNLCQDNSADGLNQDSDS